MPSPNPVSAASRSAAVEVVLPHAAPFRLVDRIVAVDLAGGSLVAERLITVNDALWPAESQHLPHFFSAAGPKSQVPGPTRPPLPAPPVFPQTLLIEALCQAAACLNSLSLASPSGIAPGRPQQHHGYLVAITDLKFQAFAYVGDTLTLKVVQKERLGQVIAFSAEAIATSGAAADPAKNQTQPAQPRQVAAGRLLFAVTVT